MSNIMVRKHNGEKVRLWDPIQTVRHLLRDPFSEMAPMWPTSEFAPAFEVKETKDAFVFKADMPGVGADDLSVTLTGNQLAVSGKRESAQIEESDSYYTCERTYGGFSRLFTLPERADAEQVNAELKDGVLTLAVAKKAQAQAKKIEVSALKAKA